MAEENDDEDSKGSRDSEGSKDSCIVSGETSGRECTACCPTLFFCTGGVLVIRQGRVSLGCLAISLPPASEQISGEEDILCGICR